VVVMLKEPLNDLVSVLTVYCNSNAAISCLPNTVLTLEGPLISSLSLSITLFTHSVCCHFATYMIEKYCVYFSEMKSCSVFTNLQVINFSKISRKFVDF